MLGRARGGTVGVGCNTMSIRTAGFSRLAQNRFCLVQGTALFSGSLRH